MGIELLQAYQQGKLRALWEQGKQGLIEANPQYSPLRCGEIMAGILCFMLGEELEALKTKTKPFSMTPEEEGLYDWLFMYKHDHILADLQNWSGTRTLLADTPTEEYQPEWMKQGIHKSTKERNI